MQFPVANLLHTEADCRKAPNLHARVKSVTRVIYTAKEKLNSIFYIQKLRPTYATHLPLA